MTVPQAKRLITEQLKRTGRTNRVTARTIGFDGDTRIFVRVHDWAPHPHAGELQDFARARGFRVEFQGKGFVN